MRSQCGLYVDAGYLLAAAATRVAGTSLRGGVAVDYPLLIDGIIAQAERASGLSTLRVNWYDSGSNARGLPDADQDAIGMLPKVKVRLGRRSPSGEQKGVDLRIGLDLATHARNRVVDVMYLISGDDDLTEAVEEAQGHGIEVVVLAAPDAGGRAHAVARHLQREADDLLVIDPAVIDAAVTTSMRGANQATTDAISAVAAACTTDPGPGRNGAGRAQPSTSPEAAGANGTAGHADGAAPSPAALARRGPARPGVPDREAAARASARAVVYSSSTGDPAASTRSWPGHDEDLPEDVTVLIEQVCTRVVRTWRDTASAQDQASAIAERPYVPGDLDRALITDLSASLGTYYIDEPARHELRNRFWALVDAS